MWHNCIYFRSRHIYNAYCRSLPIVLATISRKFHPPLPRQNIRMAGRTWYHGRPTNSLNTNSNAVQHARRIILREKNIRITNQELFRLSIKPLTHTSSLNTGRVSLAATEPKNVIIRDSVYTACAKYELLSQAWCVLKCFTKVFLPVFPYFLTNSGYAVGFLCHTQT